MAAAVVFLVNENGGREGRGQEGREREAVGPTNREQRERLLIDSVMSSRAHAHAKQRSQFSKWSPNEGNMQTKGEKEAD